MVAASQPLAVSAGLEILSVGGNAADAAIAIAAALNVTEPTSTGIGGDCFALYYDASSQTITALNGSGRAPAALTIERLRREGLGDKLPPYHPYTITIPGACAGWCDLLQRFGRLALTRVLEPAVRLAEEGFPVAPITAYFWARGVGRQLSRTLGGQELTIDGRSPRPGEIFRNPGLARTLRKVAQEGKDAFYRGEIAEAIVAVVQQAGGCLTLADLAVHTSTWETPISTTYRGVRIWECPPNGQGLTALLALNILEGFDLGSLPPFSARRLHLEIEAMRLAFADSRWYVADSAFVPAPLGVLLSKEYAAQRRCLLDMKKATLDQKRGMLAEGSDTVYFCVVDKDGNACSFINSNYMGFGTGIVPKGWGFTLQNRGHTFSLDPAHPNALLPGKRPYHTIIPGMITVDQDTSLKTDVLRPVTGELSAVAGQLVAPFGVMGGFMQPQGHVQVVVALVDDGLDPQQALERPRFCIEDGMTGGRVALEEGIPHRTIAQLRIMGHLTYSVDGYERSLFGRGQIIRRDPFSGVLCGGSDPRADGCVMGF